MNPSLVSSWLGLITYERGLELQEQLVDGLAAGESGEHLLLLEHEPVYTMGRSRDDSSLRNPIPR